MKSKVAELVVELSTTPFFMAVASATADIAVDDGLQHETGTEELLNLLTYEVVQILPACRTGLSARGFSVTDCGFH